jgi:hypothetical protein
MLGLKNEHMGYGQKARTTLTHEKNMQLSDETGPISVDLAPLAF